MVGLTLLIALKIGPDVLAHAKQHALSETGQKNPRGQVFSLRYTGFVSPPGTLEEGDMKIRTGILMRGAFAALLLVAPILHSQDARYFRVSGPMAATITEFRPDGTLVWTNTPTNTTFTVQKATSLGGGTNWVDYVQIPVTNGVTTNRLVDFNPPIGMALIPAGSFTMGDIIDALAAGIPLHNVFISAFYLDRHEVTKMLWTEVKEWNGGNGYVFSTGSGSGKAANHPVHTVSWFDVVKWCNARSQKEGLMPCYYSDASLTNVYKAGHLWPYVNWGANGYRLATEAEWEKAARGGESGRRFPWSGTDTIQHIRANYLSSATDVPDTSPTRGYHPSYKTNGFPYTSPVGSFAPNGYGLYDMAGNVSEWCWDWYGSYSSASQTDPRGPAATGSDRVVRGGSWGRNAFDCRTAFRGGFGPSVTDEGCGFRTVRSAD